MLFLKAIDKRLWGKRVFKFIQKNVISHAFFLLNLKTGYGMFTGNYGLG